MTNRLEKISEAVVGPLAMGLQGFGAGLQGTLPQWQQAQTQALEQEQANIARTRGLELEERGIELQEQQFNHKMRIAAQQARIKANVEDVVTAKFLFDKGDYKGIAALGLDRLRFMSLDRNVDPSDTQRITALAAAASNGDKEAVSNLDSELNGMIQKAQILGYLKAPAPYKATTNLGKLKQDLKAGLVSQEDYETAKEALFASKTPSGVREQRIQDYMREGMTRPEAVTAVDSQYRIDEQGNPSLFNPKTGKVTGLEIERTGTGTAGEDKSTSRMKLKPFTAKDLNVDLTEALGYSGTTKAGLSASVGQLIDSLTFPEQTKEGSKLAKFDSLAKTALTSSTGRRFKAEYEDVNNLIPKRNTFFENPNTAIVELLDAVNLLGREYHLDTLYSKDRRIDSKQRDQSAQRARLIKSALLEILTPAALERELDIDVDIGDIEAMTLEELKRIDPSTLNEEQLDVILKRLRP